jgi:hypothetical protein
MSRSRLIGQSLAVPALIVAVGVLWMYCSGFLAADLRQMGMPKPFAAPIAAIASLLLLLLAPPRVRIVVVSIDQPRGRR